MPLWTNTALRANASNRTVSARWFPLRRTEASRGGRKTAASNSSGVEGLVRVRADARAEDGDGVMPAGPGGKLSDRRVDRIDGCAERGRHTLAKQFEQALVAE